MVESNTVSTLPDQITKTKNVLFNLIEPYINTERKLFSWFIIASIVALGNIESVFGLDTILLDDQMWYYRLSQDGFTFNQFQRNFVGPFLTWIYMSIFMVSPVLARAFFVLLIMIPLSIILYQFYFNYLKLPKSIALTGSVLPNILPFNTLIPTFINGSYTIPGLLLVVLVFITSIKYIEKDSKFIFHLIIPILLFLVSQTMTQTIFLFPCILLYYIFQDGKIYKKSLCILYLLLIGIFKIVWVKINPVGPINKPVQLGTDQILDRFHHLFTWTSVVEYRPYIEYFVLFFIILSFIILIRQPKMIFSRGLPFTSFSERSNIILLYTFLFLWLAGTSVVFITMTKYYSARYLHISSFAVNILLLLILFSVFYNKKIRIIFPVILSILILYSISERYTNQKKNFYARNRDHKIISDNLNSFDIKKNAQIAIINAGYHTGGYYYWGSGYLQFVTKRNDITGHLHREMSFFDAFEGYFGYKSDKIFRGFRLERPFYAYMFNRKKKELIPVKYFLRWLNDTDDAQWEVYNVQDGQHSIIKSGKGISKYIEFLKNNLHLQKEILWSKCPDKKTVNRVSFQEKDIEEICKLEK